MHKPTHSKHWPFRKVMMRIVFSSKQCFWPVWHFLKTPNNIGDRVFHRANLFGWGNSIPSTPIKEFCRCNNSFVLFLICGVLIFVVYWGGRKERSPSPLPRGFDLSEEGNGYHKGRYDAPLFIMKIRLANRHGNTSKSWLLQSQNKCVDYVLQIAIFISVISKLEFISLLNL